MTLQWYQVLVVLFTSNHNIASLKLPQIPSQMCPLGVTFRPCGTDPHKKLFLLDIGNKRYSIYMLSLSSFWHGSWMWTWQSVGAVVEFHEGWSLGGTLTGGKSVRAGVELFWGEWVHGGEFWRALVFLVWFLLWQCARSGAAVEWCPVTQKIKIIVTPEENEKKKSKLSLCERERQESHEQGKCFLQLGPSVRFWFWWWRPFPIDNRSAIREADVYSYFFQSSGYFPQRGSLHILGRAFRVWTQQSPFQHWRVFWCTNALWDGHGVTSVHCASVLASCLLISQMTGNTFTLPLTDIAEDSKFCAATCIIHQLPAALVKVRPMLSFC